MQKKLSSMRGFTLIELLVVIAIIGILSAVVLASLNTARQKGSDAAVKTDITTVRTQAAIYYSDKSNYGSGVGVAATKTVTGATFTAVTSSMFFDPTTVKALTQALKDGAGSVSYAVGKNGSTYAVAAKLNNGSWYCTDANGTAKEEATAPVLGGGPADAQCP